MDEELMERLFLDKRWIIVDPDKLKPYLPWLPDPDDILFRACGKTVAEEYNKLLEG